MHRYSFKNECKRLELLPDNIALYECRSGTYKGVYYHPVVNLETGEMDCHCKDFDIRHAKAANDAGRIVSLENPRWWCKHLKHVVLDLIARNVAVVVMVYAESQPAQEIGRA